MNTFYVVNKKSPSPNTVYVSGGYKREIEKIVGYKVKSKQNWGNWMFLIKRKDLVKVYKAKEKEIRIREKRRKNKRKYYKVP